jgi:hypothetical protein
MMSLELTKEDLIEAAARGFERVLSRPENQAMLAEAAASSLANLFEMLSPAAAAELLGKSEVVLRRNHVEWGLDKSVAFGREGERFFLSQIIAAAREKMISGRRIDRGEKVTAFRQPIQQAKAS